LNKNVNEFGVSRYGENAVGATVVGAAVWASVGAPVCVGVSVSFTLVGAAVCDGNTQYVMANPVPFSTEASERNEMTIHSPLPPAVSVCVGRMGPLMRRRTACCASASFSQSGTESFPSSAESALASYTETESKTLFGI
jgi:hypothetical protein